MVRALTETYINNKNHLKIIQITDMHLFADKAQKLHGYCTYRTLSDTVDYIIASEQNPDFVLVTGDISQDETTASYQLAREQFERLNIPIYWIHGNHDDETKVQAVFNATTHLKQLSKLTTPFWDFVGINTCRRGTDSGYIENSEMAIFYKKLAESKINDKKIVVVMHHHPYPVTTPLVDACMLQESEYFLGQLKENKQVKLILCGHVHGEYQITHDEHVLEACPATCFQWEKGTEKVTTEDKRGFKVIDFYVDAYESTVSFI
ncbi:MAG: metallophosphoesterase [Ottowia sp.]|nr:metallophosphoesterase [Ottowia sp.]